MPYGRGRLVFSPKRLPGSATEEAFRRFRLENRLPVQGIDYGDEMVLNVFGDDAVSFTKGCYLGQEVLARVHYRAKPPKKLVVRRLKPGEIAPVLTSVVTDPETGGAVGFTFEENGP